MNILVVLIPVSLVLGAAGLAAFLWTLRHDQYDDPAGNAARILMNDLPPMPDAPERKKGGASGSETPPF